MLPGEVGSTLMCAPDSKLSCEPLMIGTRFVRGDEIRSAQSLKLGEEPGELRLELLPR